MALNAQLASEFYQIVLSGAEPNDHKVGIFHGIKLTRERFRQTSARTPDHDKNQHASDTATLDDIEVGGGNTLLHASAFYGDVNMASYLTRHGLVDINATNDLGETALLIACKYNSYDVLDLLLTNGADASITDERGENGLFWLTSIPQQSTQDIARRLCANGAGLMWAATNLDETENIDLLPDSFFDNGRVRGGPLLQAIARRDLHSVKILLQLCIESYDEPLILAGVLFPIPLRLASEIHLFEILEFLCLQLGEVLKKIRDEDYKPEIVGEVLLYITKSSSILRGAITMTHHIHRLCYHGEEWKEAAWKTMGVLHKFGFVTSRISGFGSMERTLNFAIASGSYEIVEELLNHRRFLNVIDEADEEHHVPPVHKALNSRRLDILQLLIEKGATVDLRKKRDPGHNLSGVEASYLHVIASLRIEDNAFAELLLDQGIPPDIKDKRGLDAFGLAMTRCSFDLGRLLLSRGYGLQAEGIFGVTVLGERFIKDMAQQHDDIYETVKYVLLAQQL
jgi:ankyrin repeat protein